MPPEKGTPTHRGDDSTKRLDEDTHPTDSISVGRRTCLALGAALATGIPTGAGAEDGADEGNTASEIDVVEEGADPTGQQPIDGILHEVAANDATVHFPEGTYLVENLGLSYENLTLRGDQARIVPTSRNAHSAWEFRGNGTRLIGFIFDYTNVAWAPMIHFREPGTSRASGLAECYFQGMQSTGGGTSSCIRPEITDPNGSGIIQDVYFPDGSADPQDDDDRRAVLVEDGHLGELTFRRCWFEHWAENTLYIRGGDGHILVEDCYLRNTNAGVRCGGNTTMRGCTVVLDGPTPAESRTGDAAMWFPRIDGGAHPKHDHGEIVIEDCDIHFEEAGVGGQPIRSRNPPNDGSPVVVRNTRIRTERDAAIWIEDRSDATNLVLQDVHLTNNDPEVAAIQVDNGAANVDLDGLCVSSAGPASNREDITTHIENGPDEPDLEPPMPTPEAFLES